jgi:hypothetical protein
MNFVCGFIGAVVTMQKALVALIECPNDGSDHV